MGRIRLPVLMVLAVLAPFGGPLGLAGAQPATPTAVELPEAPAPYGLGGVALPEDADAIAAVFARMPREVAGEVNDWQPTISRGEGFAAMAYGVDHASTYEQMHLSAVDLSGEVRGPAAGPPARRSTRPPHGSTPRPALRSIPASRATGATAGLCGCSARPWRS